MKRRNGLEYACANKLLVGFKLCYIYYSLVLGCKQNPDIRSSSICRIPLIKGKMSTSTRVFIWTFSEKNVAPIHH